MVRKAKSGEYTNTPALQAAMTEVMDALTAIFTEEDTLLKSQSVVPVFYLAAQLAIRNNLMAEFGSKISSFYESLEINRALAADDISKANFELLEFDRMSQQGTNDAASIRERADTVRTSQAGSD